MRRLLPIAALLFAACTITTGSTFIPECHLVASMDPVTEPPSPGDEVSAHVHPLTSTFDTTVRVDGLSATVTAVERDSCSACDTCLADTSCNACGICTPCDDACSTCTEQVKFLVPAVDGGTHSVTVIDSYGSTEGLSFAVAGTHDTDVPTTTGTHDTDVTGTTHDTDVTATGTTHDTDVTATTPPDTDVTTPTTTPDTDTTSSGS